MTTKINQPSYMIHYEINIYIYYEIHIPKLLLFLYIFMALLQLNNLIINL
jgi:hypothetical protein